MSGIGILIGGIVLYYIISIAIEDGMLKALEKHDKFKEKENNTEKQ